MEELIITRLAAQKRNPERINVYINNEFAFGLYRDTAAWLTLGTVLTEDKIKKLLDADKKTEVYKKAMNYIAYKPRTVYETERKLRELGYDDVLIIETLTDLESNGLLDDAYFAERWAEERSELKHKSSRAIFYELRQKGIPDNLIQSAVEDVDDFRSAYEITENRLYRYENLPKFEFSKKLWSFLAGKGFSSEVIAETIQKLWAEIQTSRDDS